MFSLGGKTTDVEAIYDIASKAIEKMNKTQMPVFLRLHYYRYLEHVGVCQDFDAGYRSKKEFEEWKKIDPVLLQRKKLVALFSETQVIGLETEIQEKVDESFARARNAEFCDACELYEGVWT